MPVDLGYDALNDKMEVKLKSEHPDENDENVENDNLECKEECDPLGVQGECIFMDVGEFDSLTGVSYFKGSTNFWELMFWRQKKVSQSIVIFILVCITFHTYR